MWVSEQAQSADAKAFEKSIHLSIWEVLMNHLCLKYVYDCFLSFLKINCEAEVKDRQWYSLIYNLNFT